MTSLKIHHALGSEPTQVKTGERCILAIMHSFYMPELKTEEGYSAKIVRTYIPVRTTSHEGYMSHEGDVVRT